MAELRLSSVKRGDLTISERDDDLEVEFSFDMQRSYYINERDAIKIVKHLMEQFEISQSEL